MATAAAFMAACSGDAPDTAADAAAAVPEVRVVLATTQTLTDVEEVPGRVQAYRTAEVRARVNGIVQRRLYQEGSNVEEGQPLFLIDPREMRAAVNAAAAALERAEAEVANARQDIDRYDGLVADGAISAQEYDAAVARLRSAEAGVAEARAQLERAELDLSFTTVTAPISGRAGRAQVTEGALVSAASATLLTTIEQLDPIYVNFSASSGQLLQVRRSIAEGSLQVSDLESLSVTLILEDGSLYRHEGFVDFLDLSFDEATGTAALRAEFPNPDWVLLPRQFVRARVEIGQRPNVMLIPQRAVQFTDAGANVLLVGPENRVTPRPVELGETRRGQWVVTGGLDDGDQVIVDGVQQIQPGQQVDVEIAEDEAGRAAPAPAGEAANAPAPASVNGPAPAPANGPALANGPAPANEPAPSRENAPANAPAPANGP